MIPGGTIRWKVVSRLVRAGLRRVDAAVARTPALSRRRLLLVTHLPIADVLREAVEHGRWSAIPDLKLRRAIKKLATKLDVAHYGGLRGLNEWTGTNVLTIGDPWRRPEEVEDMAALFGLDGDQLARAIRYRA